MGRTIPHINSAFTSRNHPYNGLRLQEHVQLGSDSYIDWLLVIRLFEVSADRIAVDRDTVSVLNERGDLGV